MKQVSLILNIVLLIAVGVLFYLHFSFVKEQKQKEVRGTAKQQTAQKFSYVNIDSLEAHSSYFQKRKNELSKKQQSIQKELSSRANAIQRDIKNLQEKGPTMTQSEGMAAQKKIVKKRQLLQKKEQELRNDFMQQQQEFNQNLHTRLQRFLEKYNANKHYDFILSYSSDLPQLLYKNRAYNITGDVIRGLNADTTSSSK